MPTANPFTRALLARAARRRKPVDLADVGAFVAAWDAFETLVVHLHRAGRADGRDERDHARLAAWLAAAYPRHAPALATHWPGTTVAGVPAAADPFRTLIERPSAAALAADRAVLSWLPAAREALNRWLAAAAPDA